MHRHFMKSTFIILVLTIGEVLLIFWFRKQAKIIINMSIQKQEKNATITLNMYKEKLSVFSWIFKAKIALLVLLFPQKLS